MSNFTISVVRPGGTLLEFVSGEIGPDDSLRTLAKLIWTETNVPVCLQQLIHDHNPIASGRLDESLTALGVDSGTTLTLVRQTYPQGLSLHFSLESGSPSREVLEGVNHSFKEEAISIVDDAVHFPGQQRLLLNDPVEVGNAWTIMAWFKMPMATSEGEGFQNLCANAYRNGGHIILQSGELGVWVSGGGGTVFCEPRYNVHLRLSKSPGWHHLAGVGVAGQTTFYVDAQVVGTARVQNTHELGVIGHMFPGGNLQEAWVGALRDFMFFQRGLSSEEIHAVFTSLGESATEQDNAHQGDAERDNAAE